MAVGFLFREQVEYEQQCPLIVQRDAREQLNSVIARYCLLLHNMPVCAGFFFAGCDWLSGLAFADV